VVFVLCAVVVGHVPTKHWSPARWGSQPPAATPARPRRGMKRRWSRNRPRFLAS